MPKNKQSLTSLKQKIDSWESDSLKTVTTTKHLLSNLSVVVRTDQYKLFEKLFKPKPDLKVLDVGVTSDETLKDSNIFERLYPYTKSLTVATIEDPRKFKKLYPKIKTVKVFPKKRLPFRDKSFDVVTAWATLEHVGDYKDQELFLNELLRVGRKVFVTTPYRGCFYEPHSGFLFVHWFSLRLYRFLCKLTNKTFWSLVQNLNPLFVKDINNMKLRKKVRVEIYKMLKFIPSHLVIYSK